MSKQRVPLGLRKRNNISKDDKVVSKTSEIDSTTKIDSVQITPPLEEKGKKGAQKKGKGRPSTKKGKKLVKYSMDIHPELKRAVIKAAAIYDKDVHLMWNEIIFDWFSKENKGHPGWYKTIKVTKDEL